MRVELVPEVIAAPVGSGVFTHAQMRDAAEAMFNSVEFIEMFGAPEGVTSDKTSTARRVLLEQRPISAVQDSGTAVHLRALLSEYDVQVVKAAAQIRSFVTNRLIEEAAPGNRNSIRALELLGKISEVGLFTERTEVTVKHQTTVELEQKVRDKLNALINKKQTAQDITPRTLDPESVLGSIDKMTDMLIDPAQHAPSK